MSALMPAVVSAAPAASPTAPVPARSSASPMIPSEVVLQSLAVREKPAHLVWTLRAALNVAALQCQFSPFLQTVRNYNDILKHHSLELDNVRKTMAAYFKRLDGPKGGQKGFDIYTTRTYNSFSTLDAQLPFCETVAAVGREVLAAPKGKLAELAELRLPTIRQSLTPRADELTRVNLSYVQVPLLSNPCLDSKGRLRKRC